MGRKERTGPVTRNTFPVMRRVDPQGFQESGGGELMVSGPPPGTSWQPPVEEDGLVCKQGH